VLASLLLCTDFLGAAENNSCHLVRFGPPRRLTDSSVTSLSWPWRRTCPRPGLRESFGLDVLRVASTSASPGAGVWSDVTGLLVAGSSLSERPHQRSRTRPTAMLVRSIVRRCLEQAGGPAVSFPFISFRVRPVLDRLGRRDGTLLQAAGNPGPRRLHASPLVRDGRERIKQRRRLVDNAHFKTLECKSVLRMQLTSFVPPI
jgi:hypothetical protein